jgi:hypothetical protein
MEMVNPLAAFRDGYDLSQGFYDARTRKQAGNALAQGDYQGGANALLGGGMINDGMGMLQYDQKNRQMQAEQERAEQEQAKATQAAHMQTLLRGAQGLRQLPPEARRQAYETQVKPLLLQMGLDQDPQGQMMLAKWEQSQFTDGELDPFITTLGGKLQEPEFQIITPGNGQRPYAVEKGKPSSFQYVGPEVQGPGGEWKEVGGNLWFFPADGSRPQKGDAITPTPKTFAPGRGRSGGRGGGAPSAPPRSYGSGATPQWD